jgi:perosamine synthetase
MIPVAKPYIGPEEENAVAAVIKSGMLAAGPKVVEFEKAFGEFCKSEFNVACSSGTAGLCASTSVIDAPRGSKILTSPFSFIATGNSILYSGYKPVFIDVDPDTFMITADGVKKAFEADPDIKAVIPVHLYGQACEIHEIVEIAHHYGAIVIEDCAQAHGATENGVPVGAIGDLGVFSFYPTKNMGTGEGGMITGSNQKLVELAKLHVNHGAPVRYHHTHLGFNYRMTSIAAAIGLVQLQRLPGWNDQRRYNANKLSSALNGIQGLKVPVVRQGCEHVYHQYVIECEQRDALTAHLDTKGVGTAVHYPTTIPDQPYYKDLGYNTDNLPIAHQLTKTVLSLPVHPLVSEDDLLTIINAVKGFFI